MIKTAGELITQAQKQIDCVNPVEAKTLFDSSDDAVIIDVREAKNYDESSLNDSISIPRGLIEMLIEKNCQNCRNINSDSLCWRRSCFTCSSDITGDGIHKCSRHYSNF